MKVFIATFIVVALTQVSCLKSDVYFRNYTPDQEIQIKEEVNHKRLSFYGFGYWPEHQTVHTANLCPEGEKISRVLTETGFFDGFLSAVTLNIYTPRSMYYSCAKEKRNDS